MKFMSALDRAPDLLKGSLGLAFTSTASVVSFCSSLEPVLRVVSLLVGIAVGVLTAFSIGLSVFRKLRLVRLKKKLG